MSQAIVFLTLGVTMALFAWGRIRHDLVALIALFAVTVTGVLPAERAFTGFGHAAVITVAAVLMIGRALERSGLIDLLAGWVAAVGNNLMLQILTLSVLVAVASAFMNNVGALAVMMPVAIHLARKSGNPPSYMLMPLAFASLLGGMTTLIGTPPNIIIATVRADLVGSPFDMFDFSPVGMGIAVAGILFTSLIGWRLLPKRVADSSQTEMFQIDEYITEVRVTKDSKVKGMSIGDLEGDTESEVQLLGLVRRGRRFHAPESAETLKTNDILIIEADTEDLEAFLDSSGTRLVGGKKFRKDATGSEDIEIAEVVVMNDSVVVGETAAGLNMRTRYGLNLLAVARREAKIRKRLDHVVFRPGDVLLLQGRSHMIHETVRSLGCLPLAKRSLRIGIERRLVLALGIFGAAIALVVFGLLPVQVAFTMAAVAMILSRLLPLKDVYTHVDWPVIVLLGGMIPVGESLQITGGADLIAGQILLAGESFPTWAVLAIVLIVTMFLSDIINNAATVVLMAPIGIGIADGLGTSVDPFLMAVAVGGSCAFLTPVGHQSNTLVMGPGGYKFSDYWRMGLPLEVLIVILGVPLILTFWPL